VAEFSWLRRSSRRPPIKAKKPETLFPDPTIWLITSYAKQDDKVTGAAAMARHATGIDFKGYEKGKSALPGVDDVWTVSLEGHDVGLIFLPANRATTHKPATIGKFSADAKYIATGTRKETGGFIGEKDNGRWETGDFNPGVGDAVKVTVHGTNAGILEMTPGFTQRGDSGSPLLASPLNPGKNVVVGLSARIKFDPKDPDKLKVLSGYFSRLDDVCKLINDAIATTAAFTTDDERKRNKIVCPE
jgi:hypothetical protein